MIATGNVDMMHLFSEEYTSTRPRDEMIIRSQKVHEIRDNLSQIGQKKSMAKSCTRPMEK
uniref:Uncharacterized protein n=1 Tax=Pristionchus pacificus TaxID=54126 RepID=A0A2A6B528_PRIPA|eukprot:PDM60995.1 hypothetical protein PRIPAC_54801 [Pristionchus pacificus]